MRSGMDGTQIGSAVIGSWPKDTPGMSVSVSETVPNPPSYGSVRSPVP
jgi:hypothetical protein